MKSKINLFCIVLFLLITNVEAQEYIASLESAYENFNYSKVVELSNQILNSDSEIDSEANLHILTLKAASEYAMGNNESSKRTFIQLLGANPLYDLDSKKFSPKIVSFFNNIKRDYSSISAQVNKQDVLKRDFINEEIEPQTIFNRELFSSALVKSAIIPGWGQISQSNNLKNWAIISASTVSLAGMVYSIINTNNLERRYLAATDKSEIATRYKNYNDSYKIRNTLIAGYALIWIYSLLDLLYFSNEMFVVESIPTASNFGYDSLPLISLQVKF